MVHSRQGFKMVVLLRLSPVIPFNAFNYFMGLTGVGFVPYVLGSIGMIPGTVFFVYLGSLLSDVKNAISGDSSDEVRVHVAPMNPLCSS